MTGMIIDLIQAAFACIGTKYELEVAPFSGLMPAVTSGQNDVIWSLIYYTPERAKATDLVLYMKGLSGVAVPAGNPKHILGLKDLCGLRVASQPGSLEILKITAASDDCAKSGRPAIQILPARDRTSGLLALDAGQIDADTGPGYKQLWDSSKYKLAFTLESDLEVGCAVNKQEKELSKAIYDAVLALRADGTEAKLYAAYDIDPSLVMPVNVTDE